MYVIPNEYGSLYSTAGGVGLNAETGYDTTSYHISLPSNKAELWFALEAERFQRLVLRQLHSERRVILEERSQRVDSSPIGHFLETFQVCDTCWNYRLQSFRALILQHTFQFACIGRDNCDATPCKRFP
jgi:hypothetical protein